jgi:hypothetical protein
MFMSMSDESRSCGTAIRGFIKYLLSCLQGQKKATLNL